MKMMKHDFFLNLAKMVILGNNKNENFKCQNFNRKCLFLTPFLETETRFSKSCLISAIGLTKYTIYGKVHWVTL